MPSVVDTWELGKEIVYFIKSVLKLRPMMKWNLNLSTNGVSEYDTLGNFKVADLIRHMEDLGADLSFNCISFSDKLTISSDQFMWFWRRAQCIKVSQSTVDGPID